MIDATDFLTDIWYFALPSAELKRGAMVRKVLLGQPVLFARDANGEAFALRDICPHRGVPLSAGRVVDAEDGTQVECPYHGWRFGTEGRCAAIPSLTAGQEMQTGNIRVRRYRVRESQGLLWVFMPSGPVEGPALTETPDPRIDPVSAPGVKADARPDMVFSSVFDCHVDHAVIGLMDPAHGPYVHRSWWWRTEHSMHEKAKRFAPVERGFAMVSHPPSKNSFAYRLLGGAPRTEIVFRLPGVRTEHITVGKRYVCGLTAVTPIDETRTEVTQVFWWDHPLVSVMKPLARQFGKTFLKQDQDMVELQKEGLKFNPRLMLIPDADTQAKWYFRLKKAWSDTGGDPAAFVHPVRDEVTLRWRS